MSRYGLHTALCKAPRLHKRWGRGGGEVVGVGGGESEGGGGGACDTHLSKGKLGELQCRRKSTQDSRIFENINLCHASLVQNNVIRAS